MDYYVSALTGNDDFNSGTIDSPFATINRAAGMATSGDTVWIRKGVYRETVTPAHSGTNANPIKFKSYNDEKVVISGCEPINPQLYGVQVLGYKIFKVPTEWTPQMGKAQVFVGDKPLNMAMWPSGKALWEMTTEDYAIAIEAEHQFQSYGIGGDLCIDTYSHPDIEDYWRGGFVTFIPKDGSFGITGAIIDCKPGQIKFKFEAINNHFPAAGDKFFLWGRLPAIAEIDNCFYLNDATNNLHLSYSNLKADTDIEFQVREIGVDLTKISYIEFFGIQFFACRVTSAGSTGITIKNCRFKFAACDFFNSVACLSLYGNEHYISHCEFSYCSGSAIEIVGSDAEIYNNVIHRYGYLPNSAIAICTEGDREIIKNNTIFQGGDGGILANGRRSVYARNQIFNVCLRTLNRSAILCSLSDDALHSDIAYNSIHDIGGNGISFIKTVINYKAHHNIIYKVSGDGIYCRNYSNWFFHNTVDARIFIYTENAYPKVKFQNNIARNIESPDISTILFDARIDHNIFIERQLANNLSGDPGFVSPGNYNFCLRSDAIACDAGISDPSEPFLFPDIGALKKDDRPLVAGAVISRRDLPNLKFTQDFKNERRIEITGFPLGKFLPNTFRIKAEGDPSSGDFYNVAFANGVTSSVAFLPITEYRNIKRLWISVENDENFYPANTTVNLQGLTINSVRQKAGYVNRWIIKGNGFWTIDSWRYPIKMPKPIKPMLLRVNTKRIVKQAGLNFNCSNLKVFTKSGIPLLCWLEANPNTEDTLIWVKLPNIDTSSTIQSYENLDGYYLACGYWQQPDDSKKIFPLFNRKISFWLKGHDIFTANGSLINYWQGQGMPAIQPESFCQGKLRKSCLNNLSGIEFNGNSFYEIGQSFSEEAKGTFFVVYRNETSQTPHQRLLSGGDLSKNDWQDGIALTPRLNDKSIPVAYPQGNVVSQIIDSPHNLTNLHLGIRNNHSGNDRDNSFVGQILEVFAFTEPFSPAEVESLKQEYFKPKYLSPQQISIDYDNYQQPLQVLIDDKSVFNVQVISGTEIEFDFIPESAGTHDVTVILPDRSRLTLANSLG